MSSFLTALQHNIEAEDDGAPQPATGPGTAEQEMLGITSCDNFIVLPRVVQFVSRINAYMSSQVTAE